MEYWLRDHTCPQRTKLPSGKLARVGGSHLLPGTLRLKLVRLVEVDEPSRSCPADERQVSVELTLNAHRGRQLGLSQICVDPQLCYLDEHGVEQAARQISGAYQPVFEEQGYSLPYAGWLSFQLPSEAQLTRLVLRLSGSCHPPERAYVWTLQSPRTALRKKAPSARVVALAEQAAALSPAERRWLARFTDELR